MEAAIQRIIWMLCVTAIAIAFKEPAFLYLFACLIFIGRKKMVRKSVEQIFEDVNARLDILTNESIKKAIDKRNKEAREGEKEND